MEKLKISAQEHDHQHSPDINGGDSDDDIEDEDDDDDVDHDDMLVSDTPWMINPLNAEVNPICHLLALLGAHRILHVSRIRVNCYSTAHKS